MVSRKKEIVRKINKGFEVNDAALILPFLAEDVRWEVPGAFTAVGKEEYRKQINNENFIGAPVITIKNEIEEGDYLAVEGSVVSEMKNGTMFRALFHNTYRFENDKIKEMTSYLVPLA